MSWVFLDSCNTNESKTPKLVIGIVVDQMNYEYTGRYWNKFSEGGFKKLFNKGFVCKNANFIHFPTYTAPGHTCIYTGTVPAINGIVANDWIESSTNKPVYCAKDTTVQSVGSFSKHGCMSPKNLLVPTITDKLRLASNMKSKVIGVALKERGGIFTAGKLGNACYWYDYTATCWITSTYYMTKLPEWLVEFNKKDLVKKYLSQPWNTLLPIEEYTESTSDDVDFEKTYKGEDKPVFPHNLQELKYSNDNLMQYSPFGNSFTKDFVIECIKGEKLGKSGNTDFLCISFSSTDYLGHMYGPNSVEIEDTYLRLDKDIEELLNFIDGYIGNSNVLYFLTSDHGNSSNPQYLKNNKISAGTFYNKEILDSANSILESSFGIDNLASYCLNQQIYLDKELIKKKNLNIESVQDTLASKIVSRIDGINSVTTASKLKKNILLSNYDSYFKNNYYEPRCGDVYINFKPLWIEETTKGAEHGSPYNYDTHVPLVFYGWKIERGETTDYIQMTDIAPTLAEILNINFRDESIGKPIVSLKLKSH
jgi:predicted AlkP superfamily pyrophosphatase or phosphodiesterase